ncbi:DUF1700 domain-containing protein [Chordicoccus furentiruminis]|uniref:DUF1700 domain-containing protein n=1 Tax=Chordicoccus furentiruminis TaxID=2709410 RepID=UPI0023A7A5F4|nr:hypothetical protein [Chordicoccus furentiruminis]
MTRQEFTDRLAARLAESLPPSAVRSQVRYYEGYIDAEIRNGKTEEEATAGLGDPVLIARSILESPHSEADFTVSDGDAYEEGSYQGANQPGESGAGDALTDTTPGGTENGSGREAAERGRTETAGSRNEAEDSRTETAGSRHEAEDSRTETAGSRAETADRRKETDSRTKPERNRVFRDDSGRPDIGLIMVIVLAVIVVVSLVRIAAGAAVPVIPVLLLILALLLVWFMYSGRRRS